MKRVDPLPLDKTKYLEISSLHPGIVRTGTLGDGSCFYHSVLKSMNYNDYSKLEKEEKKKIMTDLRKTISENISLDYYKTTLVNISSLRLSQQLNSFLKVLYDFIENPSSMLSDNKHKDFLVDIINSSITVFRMITTVMSKHEFLSIIDNPIITSSKNIDEYINKFETELYRFFLQKLQEEGINLTQDKLDICNRKIKKFVSTISNFIVKKQYEQYKNELKSTDEWASDLMFAIVADYLDIDIYFININNKEVIVYDHVSKGNRPSVVVGSINGNHFESIGISVDNKVRRMFPPDDPFIMKLKEVISSKKK